MPASRIGSSTTVATRARSRAPRDPAHAERNRIRRSKRCIPRDMAGYAGTQSCGRTCLPVTDGGGAPDALTDAGSGHRTRSTSQMRTRVAIYDDGHRVSVRVAQRTGRLKRACGMGVFVFDADREVVYHSCSAAVRTIDERIRTVTDLRFRRWGTSSIEIELSRPTASSVGRCR
jgi:hypothetical protein